MNDWMDKAEGKPVGSSNAGIDKERVRQGYDKATSKKHEMAKKIKSAGFNHEYHQKLRKEFDSAENKKAITFGKAKEHPNSPNRSNYFAD